MSFVPADYRLRTHSHNAGQVIPEKKLLASKRLAEDIADFQKNGGKIQMIGNGCAIDYSNMSKRQKKIAATNGL